MTTTDPPDRLARHDAVVEDPTGRAMQYAFGDVIGKGGMGEVVLAHDRRIGRDVAVKRLRDDRPSEVDVERFLREARIQARLDHPAIVPVHEIGTDMRGRPFFTMKRLSGVTLAQQLAGAAPPRQNVLRAFTDVCLAVEFAHSRGVVHRDLKPSNIMLGEYGEVYVLDWGLARVVGDAEAELYTGDIESLDGEPIAGKLFGTPGYMAPEQLHSAGEVGRPVDVYALGAIMFEILAGAPLHPRVVQEAIASTLAPTTVSSPADRRPDRAVAPELDALCVEMLATDATARPTARQVAERIQAYVDGDGARRRAMATELLWRARGARDAGQRAEAMRAAGRALALDPESAGAAELVSSLVLEPPREPPAELRAELRGADAEGVRRHARTAVFAYLALASFLPIAAINGIRKWDVVLGLFAIAIALAFSAWRLTRAPDRRFRDMMLYAIGNAVMLAMLSRMAGPFTFVPGVACFVTMSVMAYPAFAVRAWVLVAVTLAGFLAPLVLEWAGWITMTWEIQEGMLISHAGALVVGGAQTVALVVAASVVTIAMAGVHAASIARANRQAQQQLVTQAWHLKQLLPAP
jgi:tRNA A-37 threonylcarbamoyl transferase component Bud32